MPNKVHYNNDGNLDGMIAYLIPTLGDTGFLRLQGIVRATVSGVFADLMPRQPIGQTRDNF